MERTGWTMGTRSLGRTFVDRRVNIYYGVFFKRRLLGQDDTFCDVFEFFFLVIRFDFYRVYIKWLQRQGQRLCSGLIMQIKVIIEGSFVINELVLVFNVVFGGRVIAWVFFLCRVSICFYWMVRCVGQGFVGFVFQVFFRIIVLVLGLTSFLRRVRLQYLYYDTVFRFKVVSLQEDLRALGKFSDTSYGVQFFVGLEEVVQVSSIRMKRKQ